MTDSVKCLGFAELLKQAKTFGELKERFIEVEGQDFITCREWEQAITKYLEQKWVSVDVLKEFSLAKEHSVRKKLDELFQDFPMPSIEKYYQQCYTGTPVFMSELWDKDFYQWEKRVFDETFSEKGSLQEKKESDKP